MKIGIAGAGIGGLAAAALLARDGHSVSVFDQFNQPEPVGSGLMLQPVGQAVLHDLGVGDQAIEMGRPITRMLGYEFDHGRKVLDVSYSRSGASRFGLALHRSVLFDAVYDAAVAQNVEIRAGHSVTGCTDDNRLQFQDGTRSGPFDLIIDAAGASSPLSPLTGETLSYGALWATVDWPDETKLARDQLSQMYRRADRMLGVLPMGRIKGDTRDKATIFWSLPSDSFDAWRGAPLANWKTEACNLWPQMEPFLAQITDHDQMTMARYSHGTLTRPWRDGVVHVGDAAHRASPQLGQGANMALLDAYALAGALRQAEGRDALALYASLRRWHVRLYQGMSWAFTPQYQSDSHVLPFVRDRLLAPVSGIGPMPWILSKIACGDFIRPFAGLAEYSTD